jgi:hypothetical protein
VFKRVPGAAEYEHGDLLDLARKGCAHIGYIEDDSGELVAALAFEFVHYPRLLVCNIIALAGERLDAIAGAFLPGFAAFAKAAGADVIEARTNDAMARMLARYGFEKAYNQVRARI